MTEILILAVDVPQSDQPVIGGFVLVQSKPRRYRILFRGDWAGLCDKEHAEILTGMEEALESIAIDSKNEEEFLTALANRLTNTIRCVERLRVPVSVSFEEQFSALARGLLGIDPPPGP